MTVLECTCGPSSVSGVREVTSGLFV